jgi:hypothetical protein
MPNAKHLDRILADLHRHPKRWGVAWEEARDAVCGIARQEAMGAAWRQLWTPALSAALDTGGRSVADFLWDAVKQAREPGEATHAAWGATAALVVWDDCAHLLRQPVDAVRLLAACGHHPAVLLLPAVMAFAKD